MKKFLWPIDQISIALNIFVSQKFGNKWFSDRDQVINGIPVKKGDDVYLKIFGYKGHTGLDIAAPTNTPVKACGNGFIIEQTGKGTGFGNRISLLLEEKSNNGFYMVTYGHLNDFADQRDIPWQFNYRGFYVKEGDVIGYVGSTGFSTGPHLHFEISEFDEKGNQLNRDNGYSAKIDPMPLMKVRLVKEVGYRKHPEKNVLLRFPDPETQKKFLTGELNVLDVFQFESTPYTLPLDKPNFPI